MNTAHTGMRVYWSIQVNELQATVDALKDRLSQTLQRELAPNLLQQAENFQNLLLNKDLIIAIIRHDLATNNSFDPVSLTGIAHNHDHSDLQMSIDKLKLEIAAMDAQLSGIEHASKRTLS